MPPAREGGGGWRMERGASRARLRPPSTPAPPPSVTLVHGAMRAELASIVMAAPPLPPQPRQHHPWGPRARRSRAPQMPYASARPRFVFSRARGVRRISRPTLAARTRQRRVCGAGAPRPRARGRGPAKRSESLMARCGRNQGSCRSHEWRAVLHLAPWLCSTTAPLRRRPCRR